MPGATPLRRVLVLIALGLLAGLAAAPARAQGSASVLSYHNGGDRSGRYVVPGLTWARAAGLHRDAGFDGRVAGAVYAQPLYWRPAGAARGLVIVATEANRVVALDAATGSVAWETLLGPPVPGRALPCGNIDPLGITGTPAIDAASGTLYLDAMVMRQEGPRHLVFALALGDGVVVPGWPVDVAAGLASRGMDFVPRLQNQRGALVLLGGRLFLPYGGHYGDCGAYHGWVVGIPLARPGDRPAVAAAWETRGTKGGIWAPGGIAAADGALFVATGNTEVARDWSDGEAVLRLGPDLAPPVPPRAAFAPADWRQLDAADLDLAGANPMPVDLAGRRLILALGKDGKAYLLDRDALGGIGGALDAMPAASEPIRTGPASWTAPGGAFVAFAGAGASCPFGRGGAGLTVLRIAAAGRGGITTAWCAALDGAGSPVTTTSGGGTDRIVWIAGAEGDDRLHGFRADTGAIVFAGGGPGDRMPGLRHFATILAAAGRLYIAGDDRVYAFAAGR